MPSKHKKVSSYTTLDREMWWGNPRTKTTQGTAARIGEHQPRAMFMMLLPQAKMNAVSLLFILYLYLYIRLFCFQNEERTISRRR